MESKEKAKELVDRFRNVDYLKDFEGMDIILAKQCALILCDEIIELHKGKFMCERENQNESYWQQVKQEIENL
jgi:hypothetical protein